MKRIIVGISGASGIIYGIRTLELLRAASVETHLVMSKAAEMTLAYESSMTIKDVRALAHTFHPAGDIGASISSGSFRTDGMIVVPCSIKTMSEINTGVTSSLLSRAADVILKERRRLVLAVRETPLHSGHLRTLLQLSDLGAIICPVVPAFYNKPETIADIVNHTVGRMLDLLDIDCDVVRRWKAANKLAEPSARSGNPLLAG